MTGHCSHCRQPGIVWRYRLAAVGLRYLDPDCAERLSAMGMDITPVTDADPRDLDRGYRARREASRGIRGAECERRPVPRFVYCDHHLRALLSAATRAAS